MRYILQFRSAWGTGPTRTNPYAIVFLMKLFSEFQNARRWSKMPAPFLLEYQVGIWTSAQVEPCMKRDRLPQLTERIEPVCPYVKRHGVLNCMQFIQLCELVLESVLRRLLPRRLLLL